MKVKGPPNSAGLVQGLSVTFGSSLASLTCTVSATKLENVCDYVHALFFFFLSNSLVFFHGT